MTALSLRALLAAIAFALAGCEAIDQFVKEVDQRAQPAADEARETMEKPKR